jgi:acetoacetate decarboxylase
MVEQAMNSIVAPMKVDYPNAVVIVPAVLNGQDVYYMSRVYEGSEQSTMLTIWGREIWGFPKVAADVRVAKEGRNVTSRVRALNGRASADVQIELESENASTLQPASTLSLCCRKTIPSADGRGLDLDRLVEAPWRSTAQHQIPANVVRCDIKLDIRGKSVAIPINKYVDAFWYTQEYGTVLDRGRDLHDYLGGNA